MVKAMALAFRKGPPQTACCTRCGAVLVSTMLIPFKEFVCLNCGHTLDFVSPDGKEETPELVAQAWAYGEVWKALVNRGKDVAIDYLNQKREEWNAQRKER